MSFAQMPSLWSIASCLFPHEENPTVPGPVAHPVLIFGVNAEKRVALAAYGTGQTQIALAGQPALAYQLEIKPSARNYLKFVTRFDFRKAVPIEWSGDWFKPIGAGIPILMGALDRTEIIQARKAYATCQQMLISGEIEPWGQDAATATSMSSPSATAQLTQTQTIVTHKKRRVFALGSEDKDAPK